MARTGRFGRAPRSAPSLTSTIVAIAREFQNQRGQNIMDAWQKGGLFEGKKATDDVVLKFWRDKSGGVSKDDPLYDTYRNTVTQLDYTIHESKMTAQYAQHKVSDGAMVSFYLNWAKKVPKDSEFYRVLQRDAGQYMRTSKANNDAQRKQAEEAAYQKSQEGTRKSHEAAGEYIIDTLRRVAQSGYSPYGIAPRIDAPGSNSDLTDFQPDDPEQMLRLLALIDPQVNVEGSPGTQVGGGKFQGNGSTIYHDDDKKPVTGGDIMRKLQELDPSFKPGAPLDVAYVTGLLDRQNAGLQERIDRATKTGHLSDAASLQKSKSYVAMLNRQVGSWPIEKAYSDVRETYDSIMNDPTASPQAQLAARASYVASLNGLASDQRIVADDNLKARLMAEANGDSGVPTLHESFTGMGTGQAKDSANNAAQEEFLLQQVDLVNSGAAQWTFGKTGPNGVFAPDPSGREIGAATVEQITANGAPGSMQAVAVPDPKGGNPMTMYVTGIPVYGVATNPATGERIKPENSLPVAVAYDIPNGGATITVYGFQSKSGMVFSSDPPWDDRLKATPSSTGGNHLNVDMTPLLPVKPGVNPGSSDLNADLYKNAAIGLPGFRVQGAGVANTRNPQGTPGELTFDPFVALTNSDKTRIALGSTDPMTDFHSLTLATLVATPSGQDILRDLSKNPVFKDQLDTDSYTYGGYFRDAAGAWVPGANADPNKLNSATNQTSMASAGISPVEFLNVAMKSWQRITTGSPFPGKSEDDMLAPGTGGLSTMQAPVNKLATDLVKGTPFAPLGDHFMDGTSTPKPPPSSPVQGLEVKTTGTLKVPTYTPTPTPSYIPGIVSAPTKTQTGSTPPAQTGSQAPGTPYDVTKDYRPGAR